MAILKNFSNEREGQNDFFDNLQIDYGKEQIPIENTDIAYNGVLLEFKLDIYDVNKVLFQAIKHLSNFRINGQDVPADILLISLNSRTAYHYKSKDYFDDIHKVYSGPASKQNTGFVAKQADTWDYSENDANKVRHLLKDQKTTEQSVLAIQLDENCIVAWAERYYREVKTASKGDFLGDETGESGTVGEIREPKHFKNRILPYTEKTNERFKYLMDKLNENLKKKDTGAFYTPIPYCELAANLVKKAIERVPEGNDYVIIDRCAGTGNLESVLDAEILSHCILATYEYYEYKVLCERLSDKVLAIIPTSEEQYSSGYILNANAMTKEFIENPTIKRYIDDAKYTIILYENPPYSETASTEHQKRGVGKSSSQWKSEYVPNELKKYIKRENAAGNNIEGRASNEKANAFIWSGFEYYLRQPTDSYVLFSPIKYWKYQHLISKKFVDGYVFNKKWFHANPSAIACILWTNEDDKGLKEFSLPIFDIAEANPNEEHENILLPLNKTIEIKRTYSVLSEYYDKRKDVTDIEGIACQGDGLEATNKNITIKPIYNDNIIGYLIAQTAGFDHPRLATNLLRCAVYNGHGFYLRKDDYKNRLPLFAAGKYPIERFWYEHGIIYKSFDGGDAFTNDIEFLNDCFIFTCLSYYNKCRSFIGSDGRQYKNELCFDEGTIASKELKTIQLNSAEQELINLYNTILYESKTTKNYNQDFSYGPYQIEQELNTSRKDKNSGKTIYDYPDLNDNLQSLKKKLTDYYMKYISQKCFKYELLK